MAACPLCTATFEDGAARCPSCQVPFTSATPASGLESRAPRPMIPTPPPSLGATRAIPLAAQLAPQPAPVDPTPGPEPWATTAPAADAWAPELPASQDSAAFAMGTASMTVTGLTPVVRETTPWWREPRVLIGAPVALVVLVVGWLLLTTGDVERVLVPVPSVVGADSLDAKTALERAGFVAPFPGTGTVTAQEPAAGSEAEPGTAVVLSVEPYPEPPAPAPSGTRAPTTPGG